MGGGKPAVRKKQEQDTSWEEILQLISELPDDYITEADEDGKKASEAQKEKKGGIAMSRMLTAGAGIAAAAVIGVSGMAMYARLNGKQGSQNAVTLSAEEKSLEELLAGAEAWYGVVTNADETGVEIEGLSVNGDWHSETNRWGAEEIADVTGSADGMERTQLSDLQAGDLVCVIQAKDGSDTRVKLIVFGSRSSEELQTKRLVSAALAHAGTIADMAADTDWLDQTAGLSDNSLARIQAQSAEKIGSQLPDDLRILTLSGSETDEFLNQVGGGELLPQGARLDYMCRIIPDYFNAQQGSVAISAYSMLQNSVYLHLDQELADPILMWLYYDSAPSVYVSVTPYDGQTVKMRTAAIDGSISQYLHNQLELFEGETKEGFSADDGRAAFVQLFANGEKFDSFDGLEETVTAYTFACPKEDRPDDDSSYYSTLLSQLVKKASESNLTEMAGFYTATDSIKTLIQEAEAAMEATANLSAIQVRVYQFAQEDGKNSWELSAADQAAVAIQTQIYSEDVTGMAASATLSSLVGDALPVFPLPKDWSGSKLVCMEFPGLVVLVPVEAGENNYLELPRMVFCWTNDPSELENQIETLGAELGIEETVASMEQ